MSKAIIMSVIQAFMPFFAMTFVQFGYSGMNIFSKLAMDSGMNPFIHVTYRQLFATAFLVPIAFFYERKTRPKLNFSVIFHIFLCSIFGATANQITYFVGLKNSNPTIACALINLSPAITFIIAVPLRMETARYKSIGGISKILGTFLCVGGALLLSFYHGSVIHIGKSKIHWSWVENSKNNNSSSSSHQNFILGPFLLIISAVTWAVWLIIQAKLGMIYAAPYSSSALTCLMASIECLVVGFCFDHDISAWSLNPPIRAVSSLYAGIVCTALAFCIMSWCIERKGPLYVSIFSPMQLIIVAICSWALLQENLHVGTIIGSVLIVIGLYMVLWGKNKEGEVSNINNINIHEADFDKDTTDVEMRPKLQDLFNDVHNSQSQTPEFRFL